MAPRLAPRGGLSRRLRPASAWLLRALLAALLAGCAGTAAGPPRSGSPALVRRPGIVLVDPEVRRAALEAAGPPALALCAAEDLRLRTWPAPGPLEPTEGNATDTRLNPVAWLVMRAGAATLAADDPELRAVLVKALDRWSRSGALLEPGRDDATTRFAVNRFLLPAIVAWALVRDAPEASPAARRRIDAWLGRLAEAARARLAAQRPEEVSARNNHAYLAAGAIMAWGALAADDAALALGLATFRRALADMRPDGSLPLETARGARALWYQRQAIASLVVLAELAAAQGYDLWGLEIEGRSLHLAVRFLLDALDDPGRVQGYAAANRSPGPSEDWRRQDLSFLERRGHGRHYMAWAEAYLARFPNRPEAERLLALLRSRGDPRPLVDEFAGGNLSCLLGPVVPPPARSAALSPGPGRPGPGRGRGTAG
jgi:poly(beta-D-mannuronate) lyase